MSRQQVNIQQKQPGMLENMMPMIGNAAGTALGGFYGGASGAKAGGMVGGMIGGEFANAQNTPEAVSGEKKSDAISRRMTKMQSGEDFKKAYDALSRIDDPQLKEVAEPILMEAMTRGAPKKKGEIYE